MKGGEGGSEKGIVCAQAMQDMCQLKYEDSNLVPKQALHRTPVMDMPNGVTSPLCTVDFIVPGQYFAGKGYGHVWVYLCAIIFVFNVYVLLAPTGALVVMMVYYISIHPKATFSDFHSVP